MWHCSDCTEIFNTSTTGFCYGSELVCCPTMQLPCYSIERLLGSYAQWYRWEMAAARLLCKDILKKLKKPNCSKAWFNELCFQKKRNRTVIRVNFNLSFKMGLKAIDRTGFSDPLLFQKLKQFFFLKLLEEVSYMLKVISWVCSSLNLWWYLVQQMQAV